ncbi:MAG: CoA-binding protein [Ignavibacteriales bacterium]|nr:CoA-binding protein [Ignavibacteriales bacterium]
MNTIAQLAEDFLAQRTIAIIGISSKQQALANNLYKVLRTPQRTVIAVHPRMTTFEGDPCYPTLHSIPQKIDGIFIAAKAENAERAVDECIELNISHVWMHNSSGLQHSSHSSTTSSVSQSAVQKCREHNITVIPGACPLMFLENRDPFHSCLRWFLSITGKLSIK